MGPVSRQDVQNIVNACRVQLTDRMASRQDLQALNETIRTLVNSNQQNQQLLRQAEYQRSQATRRMVAVEARLGALEQELRPLRAVMTKMVEQQSTTPQIIMQQPAPHTARQGSIAPEQQYLYRPS